MAKRFIDERFFPTMKYVIYEVCKREEGKVNLPIAQVKEVVRSLTDLIEENFSAAMAFENYRRDRRKRMDVNRALGRKKGKKK